VGGFACVFNLPCCRTQHPASRRTRCPDTSRQVNAPFIVAVSVHTVRGSHLAELQHLRRTSNRRDRARGLHILFDFGHISSCSFHRCFAVIPCASSSPPAPLTKIHEMIPIIPSPCDFSRHYPCPSCFQKPGFTVSKQGNRIE